MWWVPRSEKNDALLLFKVLADPTRLRLLNLLARREVCVCDLANTLSAVQPKVSRHLAHLKRAGLIDARREGRWTHYRWARNGNPLVRHVLQGLREWMAKEKRLTRDQYKLRKICCWNEKTKTRQTKARKD